MKELIKYLLGQKNYTTAYIEKNFLTQEVIYILDKYNLNLHELCYRIKKHIPLDKEFKCKYCRKRIEKFWKNKEFCCNKHSLIYRNKLQKNKDKVRKTNLIKYGGAAPLSNADIKQRVKKTCIERYGVDNYTKTSEYKIKVRKTCLKKYGVENYSQSKEFKDNYFAIQKAIKSTCQKRYHADCWSRSLDHKLRSDDIVKKRYLTLKQNNTLNTSKDEEEIYNLFLTIFDKTDIVRHYKSKLYPFACDFYIKSLDLYIEYNGTWTHGKESFDKNNLEHQKILSGWKKKAKNIKYYRNAIYTWTDLDVRKLETFKRNNLNYKIFWNLKEVRNFINNL